MKTLFSTLGAALLFAMLPASELVASGPALQMAQTAQPFVMPQSRARRIATALDTYTLKSGERPKAILIARDCMSANGYIMQDSYKGAGSFDPTVMAGMNFWSSVNGAAIYRAERNGGIPKQSDGDTAYKRKFVNDEHKQAMRNGRVPGFVRDHYAECESIRKRFGG